ncbi:MAG: hypothetical protein JW759_07830 [Candidatus Coatesbacteria bacterium]|nr:hypothetical protein [Candidatus Coatesbacteria bacterium]
MKNELLIRALFIAHPLSFILVMGLCLVICGAVVAEPATNGFFISPLECSPELNSIRFDFCLRDLRVNRALERFEGALVWVPGLRNTTEAGRPSLPVKGFYVGIPADASSARVRLISESCHIEHDCEVLPWREPGAEMCESPAENPYDSRAATVAGAHDSAGLWPESPVQVCRIGFMRSQKMALIRVSPIQFDRKEKLLRVTDAASVEIEFVRDAATLPVDARIGFRDESCFEPMLARLLANYEQAKSYRLASRSATTEASGGGGYWYKPQTTYLKVSTFKDGVYKIDYDFLRLHGVDPSVIDPDNLKLYYRGEMAPIVVRDGGDGSFDDGDSVLFFGGRKRSEQIGWALDEYTDESVWWLCWDEGAGMRYQAASQGFQGELLVLDADSLFWAKEHFEQDVLYDGWNDDVDQDSWFWESIWNAPDFASVSFTLHAFDESVTSAATVSVRLKGNTSVVQVDPDHHSVFYVNDNDTPMADYFWDGFDFETMPFQVPAGNFEDGLNKITVVSPGDTEANVDSVYVNWVEVQYPRYYRAIRGETWFVPPPGFANRAVQYRLESFGQSDVLILDVATGRSFPEYSCSNEAGKWLLRFVDPEPSEQSVYWAARESAFLTPPDAVLDEPSTLRDASNQADLIIIAVPEFFEPLDQLVEFRKAQGLNVQVVDIQSIFDEFSYGMFNPLAMRSFLWFAYNIWAEPVATHVLLVGDASWDYRFILPDSITPNYVPSYLNPARDDKFVNVTGRDKDWYPDFAIGRMPVQNADELTKMIVNIIRYESSPPAGDWTRRALLVTGGKNSVEQETFQGQAHDFEALMPADFEFAEVFKETEDWVNKDYYTQRILSELNRGALLTIFCGHGATNLWDNVMLESSDLYGLNCQGKTSMVFAMTCHTGRFADPKTPCIGERFILEGDALTRSLAYWGSTGLSSVWNPYFLTTYLLQEVFNSGCTDMGLAIMAAKLKFYEESDDVTLASSQAWLADPMLRINLPPAPAPSDVAAIVEGERVTISWQYPASVEELAGFEVTVYERQEPHLAPQSTRDGGYTFQVPKEDREIILFSGGASLEYCAVARAVLSDEVRSHASEEACFAFDVSGSRGPSIIAAGYADTHVSFEHGGRVNLYALVQDPDGLDDIERVEIYHDDVATGLVLDEVSPGLYNIGVDVGPGLASGQYLFEVRASDRMGNSSAYFPYFAVRGWGLPWPGYKAAGASSSWEFEPRESDGPVIIGAGYLTEGVTSFGGGETTLLALVGPGASGARVSRVDIYLDGRSVGAQLCDDGLHGDFAAGDAIFGLKVPIMPGFVPGNYLFGLKAVDENGHSGAMWPFLSVW